MDGPRNQAALRSEHVEQLAHPATVNRGRVRWGVVGVIGTIHVLALMALVPYFFSWTGVFWAIFGIYLFGTIGVNIGYHRLLTHRSFKCPRWLERFFAVVAMCNLEGSPASWVAAHRIHHQHSDDQPDPHSPLVNFLWSHIGWLLVENRELKSAHQRYAKDICRDPFYMWLERYNRWLMMYPIHVALFFLAGFGAGWLAMGTTAAGVQLGLSWVIWGVLIRTVLVWHATWSVNSLTHMWGYRNYETDENSRNNWLVALIASGEGWHNNHHADQRSAAHGHRWWEFDATYLTIRALRLFGLASEVVLPKGRGKRKI